MASSGLEKSAPMTEVMMADLARNWEVMLKASKTDWSRDHGRHR